MDFLMYEKKYKNYNEMFTNRDEEFEHYHCDLCETSHRTKSEALACCANKKSKIIQVLKEAHINPVKFFNKISKLDFAFQKKYFGSTSLLGAKYYPFYNVILINAFQNLESGDTEDIYHLAKMSIKNILNYYEKELKEIGGGNIQVKGGLIRIG